MADEAAPSVSEERITFSLMVLQRLDRMEQRLERLDEKIDGKVEGLDQKIDGLRAFTFGWMLATVLAVVFCAIGIVVTILLTKP